MTEDQLKCRKALDLYIKFRTAWVAFREQATAPTHIQLKERHDAFKSFNPDPRIAVELSAVMRFLGYGRWSGSEFERYVSRGGVAFDNLHAAMTAYISRYPDDAREVISQSRYTGPPFNISAV
ncbi:MAG: hypothetical protein ACM4AI_19185 [Acidobacteriota bacterium]